MAIGVIEQEQRMGNSFSAIQWLLELEQDPWSSTPLLLKRPDGNVLVRIFVYKQQLGTQVNINRKEIHCKAVGWLGSFRVAHFERLSKPVGSLGTWETCRHTGFTQHLPPLASQVSQQQGRHSGTASAPWNLPQGARSVWWTQLPTYPGSPWKEIHLLHNLMS